MDDYEKVVSLLCSNEEDTRVAAQRLLRLYPSDKFYGSIEALKQSDFNKCNLPFVSETAIYYFYNRIVEYDGTFTFDKSSRQWVDGNYSDGAEWVSRATASDSSRSIFSSILDYAYGLVLWDHNDKSKASVHFDRMLERIRSSNVPYPSNPWHIVIALRSINEPSHDSKMAETAKPYNANEIQPIGKNYVHNGAAVNLFALPETASKSVGNVKPDVTAQIYLRADNWDLIQAGNQIGWARRRVAAAAK